MDKAKLYKALFACCDKEKNSIRPILTGVNHELVGNQWVLGASNGHIAVLAYLPAGELPENLNGKVRDEQGQDLDGKFPSIPSVMPKGTPFCQTEFLITDLKSVVNALIKEPNWVDPKITYNRKKPINRLVVEGACLNASFLKIGLGVMELYGDNVVVETYRKTNPKVCGWGKEDTTPDTYTYYTMLVMPGTETRCLIMPAMPWESEHGGKVDYTIDEARELVAKQKVKKTEKPKAWYE